MSKLWLKRILQVAGTLAPMVLTIVVYRRPLLQGLKPLDWTEG
jgi:hypothetical protein